MIARIIFMQLILVLMTSFPSWSSEKESTSFTQKDFARMIISDFNWSAGLPKEPSDRDFLIILGGRRNFHFEAESVYNPQTDSVTARNYELFGPFTGKEWLMGISEATTVHFTVRVPLDGEYTIGGNVKGIGFIWKFGDKKLTGGSSSGVFTKVDFGQVRLTAGVVQVEVIIPPEGAIDSFTLIAPDHKPIQPFDGWRFREPLTAQRMAEIGIALMNLYERLPDSNTGTLRISAADAALPNKDAAPTTINFLGQYNSRAWMRANYRGAILEVPVKINRSGFYVVRAQAMGENLTGSLNDVAFSVIGKSYLDMTNLGVFRLESGDNIVRIHLPPMGGLDSLELSPKDLTSSVASALVGVTGAGDRQITADEASRFLKSIREKFPVRK